MNLETRIQLLSTLRLPHFGMGTRTREINFDVFVIKSQYVKRTPYKNSSHFIFTLTATDKRWRFSHYFLCCKLRTTLFKEQGKRSRSKIRKIICLHYTRPQETASPTESQKPETQKEQDANIFAATMGRTTSRDRRLEKYWTLVRKWKM